MQQLIHIGFIYTKDKGKCRIFLRKIEANRYVWFVENGNLEESETNVQAATIEEAIRLGRNQWKDQFFRTLNCGFRYTLPERDEHGMNALFYQMVASYGSSNGIYFDDELGHNCFVQASSLEARKIWKILQENSKLK